MGSGEHLQGHGELAGQFLKGRKCTDYAQFTTWCSEVGWQLSFGTPAGNTWAITLPEFITEFPFLLVVADTSANATQTVSGMGCALAPCEGELIAQVGACCHAWYASTSLFEATAVLQGAWAVPVR